MDVKLIYSTKDYHKLVETVARVCYQSYHKDDVNSHNFIKAIMSKGHISIASVGNMVFSVKGVNTAFKIFLIEAHEVTPFIKWTVEKPESDTNFECLISMNMLTFLDIYNAQHELSFTANYAFNCFVSQVAQVPCLKWFFDKSTQLDEVPNEYTGKGLPSLYEPIVLDEDYTALKALGLNDYELGIHATLTMNFITDRSASLQFWRHWSGGCELSQRYVKRDDSRYRPLIGIEEDVQALLDGINERNLQDYTAIYEYCKEKGMRDGRAKEVARSVLSNGIFTQLIQSRPYKNWVHLFKLRDTKHAQSEIQEDVIHLKRVLREVGVPCE